MPDRGPSLLRGGRKPFKGVLVLPDYDSPRVKIKASKWPDNVFEIGAPDYEAAQWMADAVYHYSGRRQYHIRRNFNYPPLQLGSGELLDTRKKCKVHVTRIAKPGPAFFIERRNYRRCVTRLVLETLQRPDVVRFLDEYRADRTPVEVDALSDGALDFAQVDAAASMLRTTDTSTFGDINLSTAYVIPSFGIEVRENVLRSDGQIIGHRKPLEFPIASNLPTSFDEGPQCEKESVPRNGGEYVEWLERSRGLIEEVLTISTAVREGSETIARNLTALAEELTYLRPVNRSHLRYDINMSFWQVYWTELIAEMKTVDADTSSLGVYVLTDWPYSEFLKTLASKIM